MKLVELNKDDWSLVDRTRLLLKSRFSKISGVSAGLRVISGKEFFGLNVDAESSTVGFCAEFSAIGTMVSSGEHGIETVVAVNFRGKGKYGILPPCGKCRDLIRTFGDPYVILQVGEDMAESKKARLSELVPFPWNE